MGARRRADEFLASTRREIVELRADELLSTRVALEEVLKRFPEWSVDEANAVLIPSSTTRGYETLPVVV